MKPICRSRQLQLMHSIMIIHRQLLKHSLRTAQEQKETLTMQLPMKRQELQADWVVPDTMFSVRTGLLSAETVVPAEPRVLVIQMKCLFPLTGFGSSCRTNCQSLQPPRCSVSKNVRSMSTSVSLLQHPITGSACASKCVCCLVISNHTLLTCCATRSKAASKGLKP